MNQRNLEQQHGTIETLWRFLSVSMGTVQQQNFISFQGNSIMLSHVTAENLPAYI